MAVVTSVPVSVSHLLLLLLAWSLPYVLLSCPCCSFCWHDCSYDHRSLDETILHNVRNTTDSCLLTEYPAPDNIIRGLEAVTPDVHKLTLLQASLLKSTVGAGCWCQACAQGFNYYSIHLDRAAARAQTVALHTPGRGNSDKARQYVALKAP